MWSVELNYSQQTFLSHAHNTKKSNDLKISFTEEFHLKDTLKQICICEYSCRPRYDIFSKLIEIYEWLTGSACAERN